jgi:hypothetical protein
MTSQRKYYLLNKDKVKARVYAKRSIQTEVETGTPEIETGTPTIETGTPEIETGTPTTGTPTIETVDITLLLQHNKHLYQ